VWPVLRPHVPFSPRLAQLDKKVISLKISSSFLASENIDSATLEQALYFLVQVGRISAAMMIASKFSGKMTTKAGNIILSGSLLPRRSRRSVRQVRHACTRLEMLVEKLGFVPDHITFNLLMKALLRWKNITPTPVLRALFSRLTISGYPLPEEFKRELTALSKGTAQDTLKDSLPIDLKSFPTNVSFNKHSRPLYCMFIKAFKMRGDRENARRISNALRVLNLQDKHEREFREEARRLGRIRARERRKAS
jgi:hypothetical protein